MKVVLFCGGEGMRIRDVDDRVPKPMVPIGTRPVLWHLMKYYAYHGHTDFIICLGYKGEVIKEYFLNYKEWLSNDFVLSGGGRSIEMLNTDIGDWRITFVDTGVSSNIGERLLAAREHLEGEATFLANYSDGLSDVPLPDLIDHHCRQGKVASLLLTAPSITLHIVSVGEDSMVEGIQESRHAGLWVNAGFFVFQQAIFDYIRPREELVSEPFKRLIAEGQLTGFCHQGFWAGMDTFKDHQRLEQMFKQGTAPWAVWRPENGRAAPAPAERAS